MAQDGYTYDECKARLVMLFTLIVPIWGGEELLHYPVSKREANEDNPGKRTHPHS